MSVLLVLLVLESSLCAGVPGWSVLVKALQHELLTQNGIAEKIRTEKLS